jgi:hypothetical protein
MSAHKGKQTFSPASQGTAAIPSYYSAQVLTAAATWRRGALVGAHMALSHKPAPQCSLCHVENCISCLVPGHFRSPGGAGVGVGEGKSFPKVPCISLPFEITFLCGNCSFSPMSANGPLIALHGKVMTYPPKKNAAL